MGKSDLVRKYKELKKIVIRNNFDKQHLSIKKISTISDNIDKIGLLFNKQIDLMGSKTKKYNRPVIYVVNNIEGFSQEVISKLFKNKNFIFSSNLTDEVFNSCVNNKINKNVYYDINDRKDRIRTKEIGKYLLKNKVNITWILEDVSKYYFEDTLLKYTNDIIELSKSNDAFIVPIALLQKQGKTIINIGEEVDFNDFEDIESTLILRDLLATQRWQVLEKYCNEKRNLAKQVFFDTFTVRYLINKDLMSSEIDKIKVKRSI